MMFVHRPILMSDAGIVVSGHHKASEAGAAVLRQGGNAMDAAVATSAVLSVAIPHMNGIGGDCIALYFDAASGETVAINGSGRAPAGSSPQAIRDAGFAEMPQIGPHAISVCGLVDAWERSLERFGTQPLGGLLTPAIKIARDGIPLDIVLQSFLAGPIYAELAKRFPELCKVYGAPALHSLGKRIRNPALSNSLQAIAKDGATALYKGAIGSALISDLKAAGALIIEEDLAEHATLFAGPLTVAYDGRRVHSAPPNAQGIALSVLAGLADIEAQQSGRLQPFRPAAFLNRKAKAFDLRARSAGDPEKTARPDGWLKRDELRALTHSPTNEPTPLKTGGGDTSTLVVIDRQGNAVSWVQSLFEEFGSGVISPSTGIVMHNRLALQRLTDGPFQLRPGERPFHTLCPSLVEANGVCEMAIATPGDHGQPQAIFQVLTRHYAEGFHLQAAIEAPRIRHDAGVKVMVEDRAPLEWIEEIRGAGYEVSMIGPWSRLAGGVNAISRNPDGLLLAGADPRRASYAITAD